MIVIFLLIVFIIIFIMALSRLPKLANASEEERLGVKAALVLSMVLIALFAYKLWQFYQKLPPVE